MAGPEARPLNARQRRLAEIAEAIKALEAEKVEIYAASLAETDVEAKACEDFLADMLSDREPHKPFFPAVIHGFTRFGSEMLEQWKPSKRRPHPWVRIRPCATEYGEKTYLGVLLGDLATGFSIRLSPDGILGMGTSSHNPAIYVPELRRVIFGFASWWGTVESPDDLREISNETIDGVWYVQALKALASPPAAPAGGEG